ncbi:cytochrome P450 [Flavobacterium artemisiae]|uniref:Cytochrome P450 n=1 Tax=Flavobacterium artemisiae TaxID=2126556 RepID=A0ABW4H940_9FLAO
MTTLFLQSEIKNPYPFYEKMTVENPIYWDETNKIWAVYSYEHCVEVLKNENAHIPQLPFNPNLNHYALEIISNLARLSNGVQHQIAKETANILFSYMKTIGVDSILKELIDNEISQNQINWVDSVCKKLPVLTVLKSFDFDTQDSIFISEKISSFVKIMSPNKTLEETILLNEIAEKIYTITSKHISKLPFYESLLSQISTSQNISLEKTLSICTVNLIGLFIQSYDACRGLLSNALLQIISKETLFKDKNWIQKMIVETLRFDPPIHNTRRIANIDIQLNNITIKKDDSILVVLAGANRDSKKFENAIDFDFERENNSEHLTFGIGGHMCLAKYFSVQLTTNVLYYLLKHFKISILENEIEYEPMINARSPKAIYISLYN